MIKYPLALSSWGEEEIAAIGHVVESDMYSMGESVKSFEIKFAEWVGSKYAVMVNSGSSANLLAVASLFYRAKGSLQRGDEVIVPAVSWSTTYFPLYQYGLRLKFVDIDANTLNYDLRELQTAVTESTRAIVAVNLLGNPNDFSAIMKIIGKKDIVLLEDNCESMGAEFNNKKTGTFGLVGTFSTFFSHHMSTMEGGLVVTDNEEIFHIMLALRSHGWTRNLPNENQICKKSNDLFDESFRFILPGYNLRPLEMEGAIGLEQLRKLPEFLTIRKQNALNFIEAFSGNRNFVIQKEIGDSSWFGFSIILHKHVETSRKKVVEALQLSGIDVRPIVSGNFVKNEVVKYFDYETHGELKNANWLDSNGFFVGNHHVDIYSQILLLRELLTNLLGK